LVALSYNYRLFEKVNRTALVKYINLCPSRNGRFCSQTRPHKGFHRRRSRATLRIETCGEHGIGAKDAVSGWALTKIDFIIGKKDLLWLNLKGMRLPS
jgi:hypothetical protein